MFPLSLFSRNVTVRHGPVSVTFPRLADLDGRTAEILKPWLVGTFYTVSKHRLSGRMRVVIRKKPVGLVMEIILPTRRFKFHPYFTVMDCIRILNDWIRINSEFIK
jgi:hypothetical protein